jgi:hypothetical protein
LGRPDGGRSLDTSRRPGHKQWPAGQEWIYWSWQRPPGVSWATHSMENAAVFVNGSNSHQAYALMM